MLVLFFDGLPVAFFRRDALLQVDHLLRELCALQGFAAQRLAGLGVSGFFIGQRPLGLLQLLACGLGLGFQGHRGLLMCGELLGVPGLHGDAPLLGFFVEPGGQPLHQVLNRLTDGHPGSATDPTFLFLNFLQIAVDRALGAGMAQLLANGVDAWMAPGGQQLVASAQHF